VSKTRTLGLPFYPTPSGIAILVLCLFCGLGCQSMVKSNPSLPHTPVGTGDTRSYTVEIHGSWGKPKMVREIHHGPIPLQQVVENSGAIGRYRDLEITIVRVAKQSGQMLRLNCDYDPRAKAVAPQYDYDVLANDHVIIKPGKSTLVDDFIGPLNQLTGG